MRKKKIPARCPNCGAELNLGSLASKKKWDNMTLKQLAAEKKRLKVMSRSRKRKKEVNHES